MGVSGAAGVAGALLAAEVLAPILLLCGLCCWPMDSSDTSSTTSAGKHPSKPVVAQDGHHRRRRRASELCARRSGSSATSLHLPSTSGHSKQTLAAHRSHEEIPQRRRSHLEINEEDTRYHSAPSIIDEVLHRRDWERSSKELYIPLKPAELSDNDSDDSPKAPHAEPELSSIECLQSTETLVPCKKHHTNIKSSRNRSKKESHQDDVKDTDATEVPFETSNFYIDETRTKNVELSNESETKDNVDQKLDCAEKIKSVYKAKEAKQSINESIKTKEHPRFRTIDDQGNTVALLDGYQVKTLDIDLDLYVDELDRDGAMHHSGSQSSLRTMSRTGQFTPSSVQAVDYDNACYPASGWPPGLSPLPVGRVAALAGGLAGRARHASDGDILAPALRPESGAFSESDLELELESSNERPPAYQDLSQCVAAGRKETAI